MKIILFILVVAICVLDGYGRRAEKYKCLEREQEGRCDRMHRPVCQIKKVDSPNICTACTNRKKVRYWEGTCENREKGTRSSVHVCTEEEQGGACTFIHWPVCVVVKEDLGNKCLGCKGKKRIRYKEGACKQSKAKKT